MKIEKITLFALLFIVIIACWGNDCSAQQNKNPDTIVVISDEFIEIDEFDLYSTLLISKDTLYFKKNRKKNIYKSNYFLNLVSKRQISSSYYDNNYYVFITKKGKLIAEGYFNSEHFDLFYKEYYENGNLKKMGNFNDGAKNGEWKYFKPNSKLLKTEIYKNDTLISTY